MDSNASEHTGGPSSYAVAAHYPRLHIMLRFVAIFVACVASNIVLRYFVATAIAAAAAAVAVRPTTQALQEKNCDIYGSTANIAVVFVTVHISQCVNILHLAQIFTRGGGHKDAHCWHS